MYAMSVCLINSDESKEWQLCSFTVNVNFDAHNCEQQSTNTCWQLMCLQLLIFLSSNRIGCWHLFVYGTDTIDNPKSNTGFPVICTAIKYDWRITNAVDRAELEFTQNFPLKPKRSLEFTYKPPRIRVWYGRAPKLNKHIRKSQANVRQNTRQLSCTSNTQMSCCDSSESEVITHTGCVENTW